jgi:Zn-dependent metalloprotease
MDKFFKISLIALMLSGSASAQQYTPAYLQQPGSFITQNFDIADPSGWLQAVDESDVPFTGFIAQNKSSFGMGADDDFVLVKTTNDDYPFMDSNKRMTHHRYNQTYKNVKVEYAELFLHHKDNRVQLINAKLAEGLDFTVTPAISESAALTAAISYLGDTNLYTWQDSTWEADYKEEKEDSLATTYPVGELIIAKKQVDQNYAATDFALAWKFSIQSLSPAINTTIYISAVDGAVVKQTSNIHAGNADLSYGYGSNMWIDTEWRGGWWGHFMLRSNDISGRDIYTKKALYKGGAMEKFGNRDFNNSHDDDDRWYSERAGETTPHWVATRTWDYFKATFNRNSIDNAGKQIRILANGIELDANFSRSDDILFFGRNGSNHLGTKDIVGHEYTHGVTKYAAGLEYTGEPGALNESFSDIFGYEIERYLNGGVHTNWICGEDAYQTRIMDHPSASLKPQPSVYVGDRWYNTYSCTPHPTLNDNCGVHTNSGVQNYWFYLLTAGSAGALDGTYKGISVSGIGADKARDITYYNLDVFMGNNSFHPDARTGAFFAAGLIYGSCSNEQKQTKNAWAAVGIGKPIGALKIDGPAVIYRTTAGAIVGSMPKTYTASGGEGRNTWSYSGPWSYTIPGGLKSPTLEITDFNGAFVTGSISVTNGCESVTKNIRFSCIDCIYEPGTYSPSSLSVSPNPTSGSIHIEADFLDPNSGDEIFVSLLDMNGNYVFQQAYQYPLPQSIDVSVLSPATYSLIVHQGQELRQTNLIKQ